MWSLLSSRSGGTLRYRMAAGTAVATSVCPDSAHQKPVAITSDTSFHPRFSVSMRITRGLPLYAVVFAIGPGLQRLRFCAPLMDQMVGDALLQLFRRYVKFDLAERCD